jgi:hypothetical protein
LRIKPATQQTARVMFGTAEIFPVCKTRESRVADLKGPLPIAQKLSQLPRQDKGEQDLSFQLFSNLKRENAECVKYECCQLGPNCYSSADRKVRCAYEPN